MDAGPKHGDGRLPESGVEGKTLGLYFTVSSERMRFRRPQALSDRLEKPLRLCLAGLWIRRFNPIAETSELPDHLPSAKLLRSFGDRWAPFFVTDSLVQDQPDQSTLSMGDGPDGLIVSQARDRAAIHDLEDASFGPGCGVRSLIE